jgi:acetyl esterase/lipase
MKHSLALLFCLISTHWLDAKYHTLEDVPYHAKEGDEYQNEKCRLDFYYPEETEDFATVIWLHGGGLSGGQRSVPKELTEQGFAVIAVSYRLYPKVPSRTCIEDAAAATAWAFNNVSSYGGSPEKIYLSGYSAGGYLAALIGTDKGWLKRHAMDANALAGIIAISGQMITHSTVRGEKGIQREQPVIDEFAPLYHVRKDTADLLLITGGRRTDNPARYEENAYMHRAMVACGHTNTTLYELEGYNHQTIKVGALPLLAEFVTRVASPPTE